MEEHVWAVIMAGGVGSRFWPLSRRERPKQLIDLFGDGPLLRVTAERIAPLVPAARQLIVTSTTLGPACRAAVPNIPGDNVLEEPVGRNTAPAIGWAALEVLSRDPEGVLMVLPSDHHIADVEGYRAICSRALEEAREGHIVTLGVVPSRPETGYGYIAQGAVVDGDAGVYAVDAFKEKPDLQTALAYLKDGGYLWNAGMFFMPAALAAEALRTHEPELMTPLEAAFEAGRVGEAYPELKSISVDYAVMERASGIRVIASDFGWSDVGSWASLFDHRSAEEASLTRGAVIEIDGGGNVLFADGGHVTTVGVTDLVVVHTPDATLVCPRDASQRVREIVARLPDELL